MTEAEQIAHHQECARRCQLWALYYASMVRYHVDKAANPLAEIEIPKKPLISK